MALWPGRAPCLPPRAIVADCKLLHSVTNFWLPISGPPEAKPTKMLEVSQKRSANPQRLGVSGSQQSRRLLLALAILLAALAAILIKDRQFWFGSDSTIEADVPEASKARPAVRESAPETAKPAVKAAAKKSAPAAASHVAAGSEAQPKPAETPAVAVNRTVIPSLDVEVVAGDTHKKLHPKSNTTKLEIANSTPAAAPATSAAPATNAAQREAIAEPATKAEYPLLAQHTNVQGSVILEALIGSDGIVENMHIVSGPAILATAAEQAVREWRFKPILQNGQAVESKATITVNFTIKVADSAAKTTIAESRASDTLIITR
jgi:TonB family protein